MCKANTKMKHFDKYFSLIKEGKIAACSELLKSLERIERFKSKYIFEQKTVDKKIDFIEKHCGHIYGSDKNFTLTLFQKVWIECAYGFFKIIKEEKIDPKTLEVFYEEKKIRLVKEVALIMSRGCGKTTLAAALAFVSLIVDKEKGSKGYCFANSENQAKLLMDTCSGMLNRPNTLLNYLFLKGQIKRTTKLINYEINNASFEIKSNYSKGLDGLNSHFLIFDEIHKYEHDFLKTVLDGSSRKRENFMAFYISSFGMTREAVFDKLMNRWINILDRKIEDDTVVPFIYKLDSVSEVLKPETWQKAIPMLGINIKRDIIHQDVLKTKDDPVAQSELLSKTFGLPANNCLSYFTNKECLGNKEKFKKELFCGNDFKNSRVVIGVDLADIKDICSISFMTIKGKEIYFLNRKYSPKISLDSSPKELKDRYLKWEKEGQIILHDCDTNEPDFIFHDIRNFMNKNKMLPVKVGYDAWHFREIKKLFENYYGDVCARVAQNFSTLSTPTKIFKQKLNLGSICFDDPLATWCLSNVVVKIDAMENVRPTKVKHRDKIDVFMSMLNAFVVYENNKEELDFYFK